MIVIGLGSPFLSDDSIGPRVVRELARQNIEGVRLVESHAGGLLLLEELAGARRAVIVDALLDSRRAPGEVVVGGIGYDSRNVSCGHDCSLPQALAMGRAMGLSLPDDEQIHLVAITAGDVTTFSEQLTAPVEASLDEACRTIREIFSQGCQSGQRGMS
jgi:hydrogenase maturation protease